MSFAWANPHGVCGSREDGTFEYAWMDRVVDAMGKAGIKVILGHAYLLDPDMALSRAS